MSDLRDRLRAKARRTTEVVLVIDPDAEQAARRVLDEAEMRLRIARIGDDDWSAQKRNAEEKKAQGAVDEARKAWNATVEHVRFQSLPRPDLEALIAAHPPRTGDDVPKAERDDEDDEWHVATFRPALIAASSVDQGMTEEEWVEFLDSDAVSVGELGSLFEAAIKVNLEPVSPAIPKG